MERLPRQKYPSHRKGVGNIFEQDNHPAPRTKNRFFIDVLFRSN